MLRWATGTLIVALGCTDTGPSGVVAPRFECAEGWSPVGQACAPWHAWSECPSGQARFVGESRCAPVGAPCQGNWPNISPSGPVIYVSVTGNDNGDGSRSNPIASLELAAAAATSGFTIALSQGRHIGGVGIESGVRVVGACSEGTTVEAAPWTSYPAGLVVFGTGVEIENLTARGDGSGIGVAPDAEANIHEVIVDGARDLGISVSRGARATLSRVIIKGTRGSNELTGTELFVDANAHVTASSIELRPTPRGTALLTHGANSTISLSRTTFIGDGSPTGIFNKHTLQLDQVWMQGFGVAVFVDAGSAELDRVWITDGVGIDGSPPGGIVGRAGAVLSARRTVVQNLPGLGVFVEQSSLSLRDSFIHRIATTVTSGMEAAGGLWASDSTISLERVDIANVGMVGVAAITSTVNLRNVAVHNVAELNDGSMGRGIDIEMRSNLNATRVDIQDTAEFGLAILTQSTAQVRQLRVKDVRVGSCTDCENMTYGDAIAVADESHLDLTEFEVLGSERSGLAIIRATADCRQGEIEQCPIGLLIDAEDLDIRRVTEGVQLVDNERNLVRESVQSPATILPEAL